MCWHKWTKWELKKEEYFNKDYRDKDGNLIKFQRESQERKCLKCGYVERYAM